MPPTGTELKKDLYLYNSSSRALPQIEPSIKTRSNGNLYIDKIKVNQLEAETQYELQYSPDLIKWTRLSHFSSLYDSSYEYVYPSYSVPDFESKLFLRVRMQQP